MSSELELWPGCLFDSHCHLNLVLRYFLVAKKTRRIPNLRRLEEVEQLPRGSLTKLEETIFRYMLLFACSAVLDTELLGMARVLVWTNLVGSSPIYTNLETGGLLRSNFNPTCPKITKEAQEESILLLAATLNRQLCCQLIC